MDAIRYALTVPSSGSHCRFVILNLLSDFLNAVILDIRIIRIVEGALTTSVTASTMTAVRAARDQWFPVGS